MILFWGVGFGAYFGFRTISKKTVLDNKARLRVFTAIQEYPGIHFSALRDRTGMNRGTLRYHLSILSITGKIESFRDGIFLRFVTGSISADDRIVVSRFQNGPDRKILSYLLDHADTSQRDIACALGITPSVVSSRVRYLHGDGVVTMERVGRTTRVALTDHAAEVIRRIQGAGSHPDPVRVLAPEIPG
jgi:predicted transcriptional regulator